MAPTITPSDENDAAEQCASCGAKESAESKLSLCGRCKRVRYCNTHCQKSNWKEHKKTCASKPRAARNDPIPAGYVEVDLHEELATWLEVQRALLSEIIQQGIVQSRSPKLSGKEYLMILKLEYNHDSPKPGGKFVAYDGSIMKMSDAYAHIDPKNTIPELRSGINAMVKHANELDVDIAFVALTVLPERNEGLEDPICYLHRLRYKIPEGVERPLPSPILSPLGYSWLDLAKAMTTTGEVFDCNRPYSTFAPTVENPAPNDDAFGVPA